MNIHVSEVLSEILEPVVDAYEGGQEMISTEDFKARLEILNEKNEGWNKWRWWSDQKTECGKFECCTKCGNMDTGWMSEATCLGENEAQMSTK